MPNSYPLPKKQHTWPKTVGSISFSGFCYRDGPLIFYPVLYSLLLFYLLEKVLFWTRKLLSKKFNFSLSFPSSLLQFIFPPWLSPCFPFLAGFPHWGRDWWIPQSGEKSLSHQGPNPLLNVENYSIFMPFSKRAKTFNKLFFKFNRFNRFNRSNRFNRLICSIGSLFSGCPIKLSLAFSDFLHEVRGQ